MTTAQLIQALRCWTSSPDVFDCRARCPFFRGADINACIPAMGAATADALANAQTHITVLQRGLDDLRKQLEEVRHEPQK